MRRCITAVGAIAFSLIDTFYAQSLPYNPTSILLPQISSPNKDLAYVFTKASGSDNQIFATLNISTTILASDVSLDTANLNLPFVADDSSVVLPSISSNGDLSVYTGSCSDSKGSVIWRFTPSNTSTTGEGSWNQVPISSSFPTNLSGANFLSSGFIFSKFVHASSPQADFYIFGGMCPKLNANVSEWQSTASYSSRMLRLGPLSNSEYTLDIPNSRTQPIAEAGFTITGLTPTYSNVTSVITQQQNFVLVGGHTQTAFINMSQVAIWSLPEESWSFVAVELPSTNTESTIRTTVTNVDSRSGHTAVLSEDGSRILVFGGWVGDVSQAASPQLVVLEIGTGFGGARNWAWSVPTQQPLGPGIYGHGAVMLPGNIMMVLGGYHISHSNSLKREIASRIPAMFLNATDLTWVANYTSPIHADSGNKSSILTSSSKAKSTGLGVGVGVGIMTVLVAIAMLLLYRWRQTFDREEAHERDLTPLSQGVVDFYSPTREMDQRDRIFSWAHGGWHCRDKHTSKGVDFLNAAQTSFRASQVEGKILPPRTDNSGGDHLPIHPYNEAPGSPSKTWKTRSMRNPAGWLVGIRRTFVGESAENDQSSLLTKVGNEIRWPSPTNENTTQPRRTLVTGETLWRRKQGKGDWEDSEDLFNGRSNAFSRNTKKATEAEDEDEWDIEKAVQNRAVQVMFTVPKEKLRVVNGRVSEDDERSIRSARGEDEGGKHGEDRIARRSVEPLEDLKRVRIEEDDQVIGEPPRSRPKGKILEIVEIIEGREGSPQRRSKS